MPDPLAEARQLLAVANRIVAHEGVLDAFGHVSMRHPTDPNRYLLSRSRSPELVGPDDILEFTLDSEPVIPPPSRMYGERVIHGCIYQARPDVNAVCHHHSTTVLPFCISGVPLVPVYHMGAPMGATVPFWDSRDEFGETNLLVATAEEGASHARALGPHWMLLLRRHGATVAGTTVQEVVFRTIYACENARNQHEAMAHGDFEPLSPGEIEKAAALNLSPIAMERAWEYWTTRLDMVGRTPGQGG